MIGSFPQGIPQIRQDLRTIVVAGVLQASRPAHQIRDGVHVPSPVGSNPGVHQSTRGDTRQLERLGICRAELDSISICLLEVVADDLLVLRHSIAGCPAEPVGEPFVEVCAGCLRHRLVRRVSYEQVAEAVRLLTRKLGAVRAQQLLSSQCEELHRQCRTLVFRYELGYRTPVKDLPLNGSALEYRAFRGREAIEPRG